MYVENLRVLKKIYKKEVKNVEATPKQLEFLLSEYLDDDTIIGIHNTQIDYEYFFDVGLYNVNYMGENSIDLSNTVHFSDNFYRIAQYPDGDGKHRGKTAIILKIPKKVFTKEQGIFQKLEDERYGIPPQFIKGAFQNGEIYINEGYDGEYKNRYAIKCDNNVEFKNKELHAKVFRKAYKERNYTFQDKINKHRKKLVGVKDDIVLINSNRIEDRKNRRKIFMNSLSSFKKNINEQENNDKKDRDRVNSNERE